MFRVAVSEVGSRLYIDLITATIVQPRRCLLTPLSSLTTTESGGFNRSYLPAGVFVLFSSSPTLCSFILHIPPSLPPLFPFSYPPAENVTPRYKHSLLFQTRSLPPIFFCLSDLVSVFPTFFSPPNFFTQDSAAPPFIFCPLFGFGLSC